MFKLRSRSGGRVFVGLTVCAVLVASIYPIGGEASSPLPQGIINLRPKSTPPVALDVALMAPKAVAPSLGAAASFAVLGASAVSNTGPSLLTGDLGISPNNASSITGFPPGLVTGIVHAADAVALQAQNDVTTAYNALTSQPCDFGPFAPTDLGGRTLTPGVYCYSSSVGLTGVLTLNGQGDPNAVWVFRIGSTITAASASSVVLINGASPCNVFWQVGSSATIGTTSQFKGNILALTSITMNTGANLAGRALARTGAVTLDTNNVSFASCAAPPAATATPTPLAATRTAIAATGTVIAATQTAIVATIAATQTAIAARTQTAIAASTSSAARPAEVPEADTLLLFGGGIGGLATWLGWQWRKARSKSK